MVSDPSNGAARVIDDATRHVRAVTGIQVDRGLLEEGLCYPVQEADDDELRAIVVAVDAVVHAALTRPPCTREEVAGHADH